MSRALFDIDRAVQLYKMGWPTRAIGRELGVSHETVRLAMNARGAVRGEAPGPCAAEGCSRRGTQRIGTSTIFACTAHYQRHRHTGSFDTARAIAVGEKHGGHGSRTYGSWAKMIARCHNPQTPEYKWYGARGIVVCDRWRHSFSAFRADVGERPSRAHSIDRIDNDRGYEPGNCRWATRAEQSRNTSRNRFYEWRGERLTLTDWSAKLGISPTTLFGRLREGWTLERAFTEPLIPQHERSRARYRRAYLKGDRP